MRINGISMILIALISFLMLFGCNPEGQSETTPLPVTGHPDEPSGETDITDLGLTEEEIRMLEERGVANVDSVEVASKVAGFAVAVPVYVPDGFTPGKFSIQISGGGIPEGISPKFNNTKIDRTYTHEDGETMILLTQSPQSFSIGGSESVEICGQPSERKFTPADPDKGQALAKLTFGWEKGGFYYAITGILTENLDEAELIKMACSISVE